MGEFDLFFYLLPFSRLLILNNFINTIAENILGSFKSDSLFIHKDFKNLKSNNTYPHFDYDRKLKFYLCYLFSLLLDLS